MFFLSLIFSLILGYVLLKIFKKKSLFDSSREFIPYQNKSNIPSFGGFIFLIPVIFFLFFHLNLENLLIILGLISFSSLGFFDDYFKYKYKNKNGLSVKIRFFIQWLLAFFISFGLYFSLYTSKSLLGFYLGPWIIIFWAVMFVATTNAVNITDGLDGLAMGLSLMIIFAFLFYLEEQSLFLPSTLFLGAGLGFFYYNKYPAKIFMGDTGSLPLGFFLTYCAIITKHELMLVVFGLVFVLETLSVILQVLSFKLRKKRIFLMSPFHHHLQLKGWSEKKITYLFFTLTFLIICLSLGAIYELQGL